MTDLPGHPMGEAGASAPATQADTVWGWYLYGITRADRQIAHDTGEPPREPGENPLETIGQGELQAVVRRVPLAEFAPEAIQARAQSPDWLEAMAVRHNSVLNTLHAEGSFLPARFGAVYVSPEDIRTALRDEYPRLLAQLDRIEGCDEWGVRLYGDASMLLRHAESEDAEIRRVSAELAAAKPGRAYFLQRKLVEARADAADGALDTLIQRVYTTLAERAVDGVVTSRAAGAHLRREGEVQLMRAAFLVKHAHADAFERAVQTLTESQPGLRCEYSGPWPPYSFASPAGGAAP